MYIERCNYLIIITFIGRIKLEDKYFKLRNNHNNLIQLILGRGYFMEK